MKQQMSRVNHNKRVYSNERSATLVALGSNAGRPVEQIDGALTALRQSFRDLTSSQLYQTPAFPTGSGPDFVNAAVAFDSDVSPDQILDILHQIEDDFGRTRTQRWGQRTLDLDLIAKGDVILPNIATFQTWQALPLEQQKIQTPETLILPHPRVQDRLFVLIPLADVAPQWVHPHLGRSVVEMIAAFPADQRAEVRPL